MNNSQVVIEELPEPSTLPDKLRSEESRVLKIIDALREIQDTKAWSTLKTEVFDSLVNSLEKRLRDEAKREDINVARLNRLTGELKWAEQYADLFKLENTFKVQLQGIRQNLYGKQPE